MNTNLSRPVIFTICGIAALALLLLLGGSILQTTNPENSVLAAADVYTYLDNGGNELRTGQSLFQSPNPTTTTQKYLPLVIAGGLTTSTTYYRIEGELLNLWGYGTNWQEAWQYADPGNAGSYGLDATILPNHDLEVPPVDYIISRTYLSFPIPEEAQGKTVEVKLLLSNGCYTTTYGGMMQPETYHIMSGTWEGLLSAQGSLTGLWYPPPYISQQPVGVIPSPSCISNAEYAQNGGSKFVAAPLNVMIQGNVLNLVIIHPQEALDLRVPANEETGVSLGGTWPMLELEIIP